MSRVSAARRHLGGTLRVVRAVMRNPSLRRVELAFLAFTAVEFGTWVAVLLYAYAATGAASVGVVALAQLLPAGILAPVAASLADRFPRPRVLAAGYALQAVTMGATGWAMLTGLPPLLVYVLAATAASALTITRPAQGSLLPEISRTPEELTAANGVSGTIEGLGLLLGPLAAAAILAVGAPGAVFAAGCAGSAVAMALVTRLPYRPAADASPSVAAGDTPRGGSPELDHDVHEGLRAGLRVLARDHEARVVVGVHGVQQFTSGAMDVLFVLLALEIFLTGESGAGILSAALGLGTVAGGAVAFGLVGRRRLAPALAASSLGWAAAILVVGTVAPAWAAPVVIAIGGIGYAASDVAGRTILQRVTPRRNLAQVLGGLDGIGLLALALGSVSVSALVGVVGIQGTIVVAGLALPAWIGLSWAGLRRIDDRVRVPLRELTLLRSVSVFAPLPPPEIECVAGRTRWLTLEPGEILIREGDVGDRYYVLETGRVRIAEGGVDRRTADGPGYGFGEIALLRDIRRTATVTAVEPCVILALDRADFLGAVTGHEAAHRVAQREAAERLGAVGTSGGPRPDPPD